MTAATLLTPLPHLACLRVTGKDATSFLHGQFCADLLSHTADSGCLTGWCTAKGRVFTTLMAFRQADGWLLILPADLAARVSQRLRMFILRADVALHAPAPDAALLGLDTAAARALDAGQRHRLLRHPADTAHGPRFFLEGDSTSPPAARGVQEWARQDVECGLPWVDAGTSENFLPQELDLERWQGLSYTKGCYPGQEIVARLRYRGTVKRGLFRLRAEGPLPGTLVSGRRLLNAAGEPVATVLYAAEGGPGPVLALAVLDFSAATTPVLYGEPGGTQISVMGPVESEK